MRKKDRIEKIINILSDKKEMIPFGSSDEMKELDELIRITKSQNE